MKENRNRGVFRVAGGCMISRWRTLYSCDCSSLFVSSFPSPFFMFFLFCLFLLSAPGVPHQGWSQHLQHDHGHPPGHQPDPPQDQGLWQDLLHRRDRRHHPRCRRQRRAELNSSSSSSNNNNNNSSRLRLGSTCAFVLVTFARYRIYTVAHHHLFGCLATIN